jgi:hypothetical protein
MRKKGGPKAVMTRAAKSEEAFFNAPSTGLCITNAPRMYCRAEMCGVLIRKKKMPAVFYKQHCVQAVLKVPRNVPDIGQPKCAPELMLYGTRRAAKILEVSREGDMILVPEMKYVYFGPPGASRLLPSGWECRWCCNLTAFRSKRWAVGSRFDRNYKLRHQGEPPEGEEEHDDGLWC